jgi:hypothetical protein
VLEAIERGVQRALLDVERAARDLLDAREHGVAVQLAQRDGLEDQQVERARQEVGLVWHGFS